MPSARVGGCCNTVCLWRVPLQVLLTWVTFDKRNVQKAFLRGPGGTIAVADASSRIELTVSHVCCCSCTSQVVQALCELLRGPCRRSQEGGGSAGATRVHEASEAAPSAVGQARQLSGQHVAVQVSSCHIKLQRNPACMRTALPVRCCCGPTCLNTHCIISVLPVATCQLVLAGLYERWQQLSVSRVGHDAVSCCGPYCYAVGFVGGRLVMGHCCCHTLLVDQRPRVIGCSASDAEQQQLSGAVCAQVLPQLCMYQCDNVVVTTEGPLLYLASWLFQLSTCVL